MIKKLIDFFNVYDENGNFHNGFLQSINLSAYTDLTILNEVTMNIMDMFIHNEIGNMLTSTRWSAYLNWDKESKTYKINSDFYDSAKYSIYAYLLKSQQFFELQNVDFKSFSATELETLVYGGREEEKNYDKIVLEIKHENDTTQYGQNQRTLQYGQNQRTLQYGQNQHTLQYGATQQTNLYGATSETNSVGAQTNSNTTTNSKHPFDLQTGTFLADTQGATSTSNGARSDGKTTTAHTDTISGTTHTDTDTLSQHTDTDTLAQHTDTDTVGQHTDTNTYGDITNTTDARKDTNIIKTHTDTKTRTKTVILSPDKFFEIEKELMQYNVYTLLIDSVRNCFTIHTF